MSFIYEVYLVSFLDCEMEMKTEHQKRDGRESNFSPFYMKVCFVSFSWDFSDEPQEYILPMFNYLLGLNQFFFNAKRYCVQYAYE